jgi:hypothetical protein
MTIAEALRELIACKDLKDAMVTTRSDPYYITEADRMELEYERRKPLAWANARAALAEHDAQQAHIPALTAQQIDALIERHVGGNELNDGEYSSMVIFAAAVERAHGIGTSRSAQQQEPRPCVGKGDSVCNYTANCGSICNKCGREHDGQRTEWARKQAQQQEPVKSKETLDDTFRRLHDEYERRFPRQDAKDAARYRWLRDAHPATERVIAVQWNDLTQNMRHETLDAAIDAAMEAKK